MSHEDWATYTSLFSLCYVFTCLADLGINQYVTKTIAEDTDNFKKSFPYFFTIKLIITLIFPFLLVLIGFLIGYNSIQLELLIVISFCYALIQLSLFFRAGLQGFQLFKHDAIVSNLEKIFLIIALLTLVAIDSTSINTIVFSRLIAIILTICIIIFILIQKNNWLAPKKPTKTETTQLMTKALPFALLILLTGINEKVDQVMLERIAPSRIDTSIYAAAYRWLDASMMYLWIVLPLFFARFSFREISKEEKETLLKLGIGITSVPLLVICIYSVFYGETLFTIFTNSTLIEVSLMKSCFAILSISLFLNGCFAILSTFLTSNNETKSINYLLVISIGSNILLNFLFIPQYGAIAAAYTTLVSTIILSIGYIVIFIAKSSTQLPYASWFKLCGIFILTYFIAYYLHSINTQWFVFLPVIGTVVLASAIATKLIDLSVLKKVNG